MNKSIVACVFDSYSYLFVAVELNAVLCLFKSRSVMQACLGFPLDRIFLSSILGETRHLEK